MAVGSTWPKRNSASSPSNASTAEFLTSPHSPPKWPPGNPHATPPAAESTGNSPPTTHAPNSNASTRQFSPVEALVSHAESVPCHSRRCMSTMPEEPDQCCRHRVWPGRESQRSQREHGLVAVEQGWHTSLPLRARPTTQRLAKIASVEPAGQ